MDSAKITENSQILAKKWLKKANTRKITQKLRFFNSKSPLLYSYNSADFCSNRVKVDSKNLLFTEYCKQKFCYTCNAIRTAKLINGYKNQFEKGNLYFLTLTAQSFFSHEFDQKNKERQKIWVQILNNINRKKLFLNFKGIKAIEITQRPGDKYHLHYHILLDNESTGKYILNEWVKRNNKIDPKACNLKAQSLVKANENSFVELCKYSTKIEYKALDFKQSEEIFYHRLDFIFQKLKNKRLIQAFGSTKKIEEEIKDEDLHKDAYLPEGKSKDEYVWNDEVNNWIGEKNGELLIDDYLIEWILKKRKYKKQKIIQSAV
jgi:hypothetical protein